MNRRSVNLVVDGAAFYEAVVRSGRPNLKNGWCDFRKLAAQEARRLIAPQALAGRVWYLDERDDSRIETTYGSRGRRELWYGRLMRQKIRTLRRQSRLIDSIKGLGKEISLDFLVLSSFKESPLMIALSQLDLTPQQIDPHSILEDLGPFQLDSPEDLDRWKEYETSKQAGERIHNQWAEKGADLLSELRKSVSGATPAIDRRAKSAAESFVRKLSLPPPVRSGAYEEFLAAKIINELSIEKRSQWHPLSMPTFRQLVRKLEKAGFRWTAGRSERKYTHPNGRSCRVHYHGADIVATGTFYKILADAGLSPEAYSET